jgi:hypothetical protein
MANAFRQERQMVCLHAVVLFLRNSGLTLYAIAVGERQMLHASVELQFESVGMLLIVRLILGGVVGCALIRWSLMSMVLLHEYLVVAVWRAFVEVGAFDAIG